jgi:hypothetical protein
MTQLGHRHAKCAVMHNAASISALWSGALLGCEAEAALTGGAAMAGREQLVRRTIRSCGQWHMPETDYRG